MDEIHTGLPLRSLSGSRNAAADGHKPEALVHKLVETLKGVRCEIQRTNDRTGITDQKIEAAKLPDNASLCSRHQS